MNMYAGPGRDDADRYAAWFRALADGTRVQIVSLLARHGQPMKVSDIVSAMGVSQSTVSQHLKVLAEVGFVRSQRRGTAHHYRLNGACVDAFPTAADIIMRRSAPVPTAAAGPAAGVAGGTRSPSGPMAVPSAAAPAGLVIRPMLATDAGRVLAIYQRGLAEGNASFETHAPAWPAFDAAKLPDHRHVAAAADTGEVLGWVAVSPTSGRCVYAGVVEHSVYVDPAARHRGVGAALLQAVIASTEAAGIWTIESGIFPENTASLRLHERAGFRVVGIRERLGRDRGRWRDVLLVERRSRRAGTG